MYSREWLAKMRRKAARRQKQKSAPAQKNKSNRKNSREAAA